jgi:hypothetical protein
VLATLVGPDPRWKVSPPAGGGKNNIVSSKPSVVQPSPPLPGMARPPALSGQEVEEAAMRRCIELHKRLPGGVPLPHPSRWNEATLEAAYQRCALVTSEYAKTFYLGTQLMTPVQAKSIWAIYVWCRRTDELVDGPNASKITPKVGAAFRCARAPNHAVSERPAARRGCR